MIRATLCEIGRAFLALAQAALLAISATAFGTGFPLLLAITMGRI